MRAIFLALLALTACNDTSISSNNEAPEVVIQSPPDGWVQAVTEPLELRGLVLDRGSATADLIAAWSSSLDGVLGEGTPAPDGTTTHDLVDPTPGTHVITLTGTDAFGASGSTAIEVTFTADQAPSCSITSPSQSAAVDPAGPVLLQAQVSDDLTDPEDLAVDWSSNVDGQLSTTPPDAFGVASATVSLSANPHTITLTVTDEVGQICEDAVSIATNGAPSQPTVRLLPDPPSILSDLSAVIDVESVDPEGSAVAYAYRWTLDSVVQEHLDGASVPSSELARDQVWQVLVVPEDELGTVGLEGVATAVIPDTPPGAPTVQVEPAEPTQAEPLECDVEVPSVDPDPADQITYTYAWELDGTPTGITGPVLPFNETSPGDAWTCVVTPSDGTLSGPPGSDTVSVTEGCTAFAGDGVAGSALIPDQAPLRLGTGDFTVEAWIRPDGFTHNPIDAALLSKRAAGSQQGWHLGITAAGVPYFHVSIGANPRLDASEALPTGAWAHVALVFDSASELGTFWIDGQAAGSGPLVQPNSAAAAQLVLGDDGAGGADQVFEGLLDDVRLSDSARYSLEFIPSTALGADASTLARYDFEEGSGTALHDSSGNGYDGFMAGATFSEDSACDLDLAPTAPAVALDLTHPDDGDDLVCSLSSVSIDPEGLPVTYAGQWWVDGAPSGLSFATLPATLASAQTAEGEEWTCHVVASDGLRDSDPGTASVWVGSMPVCSFEVSDPSSDSSTLCAFEAPIDGLLRMTVSNPDGSADGTFAVDMGTLGTTWLFTGFKEEAYAGLAVLPWVERVVEMNLGPALGSVALALAYESDGSGGTGPDTLSLEFVYYDQLSTVGATEIASHTVASADATDANYPASTVDDSLGSGEKLLVELEPCGSTGVGGHGLYASNDGLIGNDGLMRFDTGDPEACAVPLRSIDLPAGSWTFSLNLEDDFWDDNTGDRGLTLYRYTP